MSYELDAVFERGVFRPLKPVDLPEQTKVHLHIEEAERGEPARITYEAQAQRTALKNLLEWVHRRAATLPSDSISARDHDRILYGRQT